VFRFPFLQELYNNRQLRSIVISPGPGHPQTDSGISRDVVKWATGKVPLLGVCMGLECVVDAMGGEVGSFWMLGQPPSNHWPQK
jgi:anthranilate synthase/indole-3-glycerol phosphate synthase/phosphoribosylanthranilate isomerase